MVCGNKLRKGEQLVTLLGFFENDLPNGNCVRGGEQVFQVITMGKCDKACPYQEMAYMLPGLLAGIAFDFVTKNQKTIRGRMDRVAEGEKMG